VTVDPEQQIRVVVGEDEPFVREGILRVLQEGGFDVVGTAADASDLRQVAEVYQPDVVVADIQMPPDHDDDGLRAALAIRAARPGTGVLVLSQFLEDSYAFALVADGAQGVGYLLKEKVGDLGIFVDAVRRIAEGGSVLDPDVVARLVGRARKAGPLDDLTHREREVLTLIAEGRSNSGIANELVVTVSAVERHVTSIFDKLGLRQAPDAHRRVLAVLKYLQA
jgi:DNA-binding NarL/FixJ family response regulator